ncbi:hypothetical protein RFI_26091 [Reticulomyxa filosa]|uniref:Class II Histidinyl-tRNA synthetase (HisRS)-like catalytic core domain-containing protein n=1 Tax=Reticulomyxa filosa TaxID=46433 RepID=X6ME14_RETFI|nr:hypothetical protein RFI_26091 [Reticulomyxa filosa]|eukprot:ETO11285.1 hypothetical protein RFI_26091 [Reticulomyxa filosa]
MDELKCYTIAPIFQPLEVGTDFYPIPMLQADIDIINRTPCVTADAELIYICTEVVRYIYIYIYVYIYIYIYCMYIYLIAYGGYQIRIGDTKLTKLMLEECGITDLTQQHQIWKTLFEAHLNQPLTANVWENSLKGKLKQEFQLSASKLKKLAKFVYHNTAFSSSNIANIKSLFGKQHKNTNVNVRETSISNAHSICDRLQQISEHLQLWNVPQQCLFFDFTIYLDDFYDGLVFRALFQKTPHTIPQWVASGGRYDKLYNQFARFHQRNSTASPSTTKTQPKLLSTKEDPIHAIGLSIDMESIIEWRYDAENTESYHPTVKLKQLPWVNQALSRSAYVFVCTQGDSVHLMKARVQLIGLLWKIQVPCECLYTENPALPLQLERANKKYALWIAVIYEKYLVKPQTTTDTDSNDTTAQWTLEKIKLKNVRQKQEIDLKWDDIPKFFAKPK